MRSAGYQVVEYGREFAGLQGPVSRVGNVQKMIRNRADGDATMKITALTLAFCAVTVLRFGPATAFAAEPVVRETREGGTSVIHITPRTVPRRSTGSIFHSITPQLTANNDLLKNGSPTASGPSSASTRTSSRAGVLQDP